MSPPLAYARTQIREHAKLLGVSLTTEQADELAYSAIRMFLEDYCMSAAPTADCGAANHMLSEHVLRFGSTEGRIHYLEALYEGRYVPEGVTR